MRFVQLPCSLPGSPVPLNQPLNCHFCSGPSQVWLCTDLTTMLKVFGFKASSCLVSYCNEVKVFLAIVDHRKKQVGLL